MRGTKQSEIMKQKLILFILLIFSFIGYSQTEIENKEQLIEVFGEEEKQIEIKKNEIVNPINNWYFGLEIGKNRMSSLELGENKNSFQGGIMAEYYFAKQWSLSARVKYFETGVSFQKESTGGWFGGAGAKGSFKGKVIAAPLDIKWEFRIVKNFKGNLKIGAAYTIETKSEYKDYSANLSTDFSKQYVAFNAGYGFNYFINKKLLYI